jgi:hypothetical protein
VIRRNQLFIWITILIALTIAVSAVVFFLFIFSTTTGPTPAPVLVVNLPPTALDIVTDAPFSMQTHTSYVIKVSLVPKGQQFVSDLMLEQATPVASDTIPVGTPGVPLRDTFGSGREASAVATLQAGTFQIMASGPQEEPLDQPEVTWSWSVTPTETGKQFLSVDIEGFWKSATDGVRGPYRIGEKVFSIEVNAPPPLPTSTPEPFITPGHVDIGAIITSLPAVLLGAGGLGTVFVLWLINHLKKRQESQYFSQSQPSTKNRRKKR